MRVLMLLLVLVPTLVIADNSSKAEGFHWYSVEAKEDVPEVDESPETSQPVKSITPYQELMQSRESTQNKLAEALLRPSVEATKEYIVAQTKMAKRHQKFVQNWAKVLLSNPELDHRLHFPVDNNALALKNDEKKVITEEILHKSRQTYGLIFIYQGNSPLSQRFAKHFLPFVKEYQFSMISVSITDESLAALPDSKHIPIEALAAKLPVKKRYLPAVFLINLLDFG